MPKTATGKIQRRMVAEQMAKMEENGKGGAVGTKL